jgi:ADP-heptose:LPS heptosyltransferase
MKPICLNLEACNGLGDLICATPTIRKISEAYGQKITILSPMPELFKNNPFVEFSYKFKSVDFDYFKDNYLVHNSFYNVGKKNERGIEYKHNRIDIRQFHAIHLGFMLTKSEMECFYLPTEEIKKEQIPNEKYVVIHPVTTWGTRTWPAINWMNLTAKLIEMGYSVVSVGKDSSEKGFFNVDKPVFNFEIERGLNLMNKTSISDTWHIISNAHAFITMDSGLLHLAGTTDTNIIHLGSSLIPEFRIPFRKGTQDYKYAYVRGGCDLECGSNMKYGVKEWGNIQGVPPLIKCLENKKTFECHPSVEQVLNKISNVS